MRTQGAVEVRPTHLVLQPVQEVADGHGVAQVRLPHALQLRGVLDGLGRDNRRHQVHHGLAGTCTAAEPALQYIALHFMLHPPKEWDPNQEAIKKIWGSIPAHAFAMQPYVATNAGASED